MRVETKYIRLMNLVRKLRKKPLKIIGTYMLNIWNGI
jgi:hypothetical protein